MPTGSEFQTVGVENRKARDPKERFNINIRDAFISLNMSSACAAISR